MVEASQALAGIESTAPAGAADALLPEAAVALAGRFGQLQRAAADLQAGMDLPELERRADILRARLRAGLEQGAFHYEFQPQFRALTGEVFGHEALVRWEHGGRIHRPARFLPLIEDAPLLGQVQLGLLDTVAGLLATPGYGGIASLNWSPEQLAIQAELSTFAARVLALGIDPARIVIEVTGHCPMRDPAATREGLVFLKDLGFKVALDAFGNRADGFAFLCNLPVDIVKIDGSLVRSLDESPRARMVLGAVIDAAHRLGHLVVAEGIESLGQLIAVTRMGCGVVQGRLLGAPQRRPQVARAGDPALFGFRQPEPAGAPR